MCRNIIAVFSEVLSYLLLLWGLLTPLSPNSQPAQHSIDGRQEGGAVFSSHGFGPALVICERNRELRLGAPLSPT